MTQHLKRTRFDSATCTDPPSARSSHLSLLTIPKDISVHILLFLDVDELCSHYTVCTYSKHLAVSTLKLVKKTKLEFGSYGREEREVMLIDVVNNRCTRLSNLTLTWMRPWFPYILCVNNSLRRALRWMPSVKVLPIDMPANSMYIFYGLNVHVEEISAQEDCTEVWAHFYPILKCVRIGRDFHNWRLLEKCPKLEALDIWTRGALNLKELTKCPSLKSVCIKSSGLYKNKLSSFTITTITECSLSTSGVELLCLEVITSSMPNLRILDVGFVDELECLSSLKQLKCLSIGIVGSLDPLFRSCPQLEVLRLCVEEEYDLTDEFLRLRVETVCSLEWLYIRSIFCKPLNSGKKPIIRKLEKVAPKLTVFNINGEVLAGSGNPDSRRFATHWFRKTFSLIFDE